MSYTEQVGRLISGLCFEDIPDAVVAKLKTCLLYGLSMAAASPQRSSGMAAARAVIGGTGESTVFCRPEYLSARDAAWLNAYVACARGQNDTFADLYAHGGCIAIPAVLALADERNATGKDVLLAMAAGYETLALLAQGASVDVVKRGFRATSVFGVFASAAASAKLLGLSQKETANALSLATQFSCGTMQCWEEGTPEWQVQVGHVAQAGITAALLAGAGHESAAMALEGNSGLYRAFSGQAPLLHDGWIWKTPEVVFKPMPGCLINQGPAYLLLSLLNAHSIDGPAVGKVDVWLSGANACYPGISNYGPFDAEAGAIMSCPFMLAMILRQSKVRSTDFSEHWGPDKIHELSRKVQVHADDGLSQWGCRVQVTDGSGQSCQASIADMSSFQFGWDEVVNILSATLDEWSMPDASGRFSRMCQCIDALEESRRASELTALMRP